MKVTLIASSLAALLSSVSALQEIVVGAKENSVNNDLPGGHYAAWFSDASPCDPANVAIFGWARGHAPLCYQAETNPSFTIQGHTNLTFIGCPSIIDSSPTGMADNGVPALTCTPVDGAQTACPLEDGTVDEFSVYYDCV